MERISAYLSKEGCESGEQHQHLVNKLAAGEMFLDHNFFRRNKEIKDKFARLAETAKKHFANLPPATIKEVFEKHREDWADSESATRHQPNSKCMGDLNVRLRALLNEEENLKISDSDLMFYVVDYMANFLESVATAFERN